MYLFALCCSSLCTQAQPPSSALIMPLHTCTMHFCHLPLSPPLHKHTSPFPQTNKGVCQCAHPARGLHHWCPSVDASGLQCCAPGKHTNAPVYVCRTRVQHVPFHVHVYTVPPHGWPTRCMHHGVSTLSRCRIPGPDSPLGPAAAGGEGEASHGAGAAAGEGREGGGG